jgi:hypothetical protein
MARRELYAGPDFRGLLLSLRERDGVRVFELGSKQHPLGFEVEDNLVLGA